MSKIDEFLLSFLPDTFIKRMKSFLWRSVMIFGTGLVDVLIQSVSDFDLPTIAVAVIGLVLGEISKYLNKKKKKIL
jgi:hypothetical protein|tara:strand:+ start:13445 stop:13672 length:228 start_codon:yes stop_codon:yes gene_type:complete